MQVRAPSAQLAAPQAGASAPAWAQLVGDASWRTLDFISDLHLHRDDPATAQVWLDYLARQEFDALFILGDLFEVWVGDDVLLDSISPGALPFPERDFLRRCCRALRDCALQRPVYVMQGNRDFLLGPGFHAATATHALPDPTALHWDSTHWLLSHGDAWCLADTDYMRFREQVRSPAWQQAFLAHPLEEREAMARSLRAQSEARKAAVRSEPTAWADVDAATALEWLHRTGTQTLLHGHTHQPGHHSLPGGLHRVVLSDWDVSAPQPRAEVLRLQRHQGQAADNAGTAAAQWQRVVLPVAA